MRPGTLIREAAASAWASKVPTILILLVTAAMCFTASAISGRNAALQQQLDQRTRDAGARVITISDLGNDGFLTGTTIETLAALSTVDTAAAVTQPATFTNTTLGWGGPTVSGWGLVNTDPAGIVKLSSGRWPHPGETLVATTAATALRVGPGASGSVVTKDQDTYAIVGTFTAQPPFEWLNDGLLFAPRTQQVGKEARVTVTQLGDLAPTERAIRRILTPNDPAKLRITSPRDLAEVSIDVGADVRVAGYDTTLLVLFAGALFVAAVTLADVLIRRRDLGRRRALGITRFDLMSLICLRATTSTILGAATGILAVQAYGLATQTRPPIPHTIASATLVVISALVATIPVGLIAAQRDPVAVLRTP